MMKAIILGLVLLSNCNKTQNISKGYVKKEVEIKESGDSKTLNKPALIYGCSFGNFYQELFKQNRYEEMLKFTSKATRDEYGDISIKRFFKVGFYFDFELGKLCATEKIGDTINLIYSNSVILGTPKRKIILPIIVENDTCKMILKSLVNPF